MFFRNLSLSNILTFKLAYIVVKFLLLNFLSSHPYSTFWTHFTSFTLSQPVKIDLNEKLSKRLPYRRYLNVRVLFFKMGFGPHKRTYKLHFSMFSWGWGPIQEWGSNYVNMVFKHSLLMPKGSKK